MPVVSIIIPTYNAEKYVKRCLDSVFLQQYDDIEVIVINDGSTDKSKNILEEYHRDIRIIHQKNMGPSAARNTGILNARGEYVAFLDADDMWVQGKIQKQLKVFRSKEGIGLVGCGYFIIDKDDVVIKQVEGASFKDINELLDRWKISSIPCGSSSGVIVHRKCFDVVGMFDESLRGAEDRDMWLRIAKSFNIEILKEPLTCIRKHENNSCKNIEMMMGNQKKFVKKNLSEESTIMKMKAYGYIHWDAAQEYYVKGNRSAAFINSLISILYYPVKVNPSDNKYRLLLRLILNL